MAQRDGVRGAQNVAGREAPREQAARAARRDDDRTAVDAQQHLSLLAGKQGAADAPMPRAVAAGCRIRAMRGCAIAAGGGAASRAVAAVDPGGHRGPRVECRDVVDEVEQLVAREHLDVEPAQRGAEGLDGGFARDTAPGTVLVVEAGDERLLRRRIAAAGALELDSERLQPPNRGKQVVHEGLHEHGIGDAAAHVADGLRELGGIRLVLGRDEPEPPGPRKEARAREEGALARYRHARAGLAGLDGRDDAGDAGTDDQHVAGADGDPFGMWIRPAVALPGHVRAFLEGMRRV